MTRTATKGRRRRDLEEDDVERDEFDDDVDEDEGPIDDGGSSGGVFAELKNVASDAALTVLAPVAKKAATSAAKYAVKKAPELLEDTVKPMLEDAGGPAGMLAKLKPGGGDDENGGDAGDGTGKGRRMPVQQAVDVAAPIDVVYDQWTQFEDYPKFMHRVERVEQRDDSHVAFHAKVWGINRMWEAEIVEQRPDERIVFKSVNGVQLTGVVTFHDMAERLTHIELNIDVEPNGPIEKIARGTRVIKRAARADLKRFKAFVEMHEDETGAWRGEIQDGDVVSESDEDAEDEYYEDDEAEASADEEYDEDEGDQDEPEEEEKPQRKPRRRSRSSKAKSSNGGDPKRRSRSSSSSSRSKSSSSSGRSRGSKNGSSRSSSTSSRKRSSSSGRSSSSRSTSNRSSSRSKSRSKSGGRK